ncbi:MAG: isoaspartyl peptidase/L-asparaginase [Saprospiraceae bacterium]|nr:isoaspartyl peptidase/L-asparaginase [Saprospiraceae bacterium]
MQYLKPLYNYTIMLKIGYIFLFLLLNACQPVKNENVHTKKEFALVIHGGAGVIEPGTMSKALENEYHLSLSEALEIGKVILSSGGKSIDAVEAVITFMENDSLFNAGKGAVFTNEGKNELDASIMVGRDMSAGAVAGVTIIKNPIKAARAVMEKSPHVLMSGKGAEEFAILQGCEKVDPSYFYTKKSYESLQAEIEKLKNNKMGTVGCVALDKFGDIVAGTSTGGMTNKKYNRVGDSPIIGAGTYADNNVCGISCTGHGEYFIRFSVAKDIASMMEYKNMSIQEASDYVIKEKLVSKGGKGGMIGLDKYGNIVMPFNTVGMYRGYCTPDKKETFLYK